MAYKGIHYRGWQRQPDVISIQEVLESTLSKALKQKVICMGCGRTDAQVHARQFFFHVDLDQALQEDFLFIINKMLPDDIAIYDTMQMEGSPHAQFDATSRTYDYFIHTRKDPFLSQVSSLYQIRKWDRDRMQEAVKLLPHHRDYRAFCRGPDRHNHTICDIRAARLFFNPAGTQVRFQITANRFLRGMVRLLTGSLLSIGTGQLPLSSFERSLAEGQAPAHEHMAYPQGLYLSGVQYPFLDIPPRGKFPFELPQDSLRG